MAYNISPFGPLAYRGAVAIPFINRTFPPNSTNIQFPVPTIWIDTSSKDAYILVSVDLGTAEWVPIGGLPGQVEKIAVDASTPPGTDPVDPDASQTITVTGGQVATGVIGTNVIRTNSLAASTYTIEIQRSTAVSATDLAVNGVCHFDSADFTVDANGFVQLSGSSGFIWNEISVVGPTSMVTNNGYVANNAGLVTLTLPITAAFGTVIRVSGKGAGGWSIAQNASQSIRVSGSTSTVGVGGSVASTNQNDCIELLCITANTTWISLSTVGNLTVT